MEDLCCLTLIMLVPAQLKSFLTHISLMYMDHGHALTLLCVNTSSFLHHTQTFLINTNRLKLFIFQETTLKIE